MVLTDAGHPNIFYDMWDAGLGDCDILYNEGSEPTGPIKHDKLQDMIDRGINAPAAMLIINENYRSTYQIGLDNQRFCAGSIRYVSSEIRSVILSKLQVELRDTILTVGAASIAVEAALVAAEGTIIAVEHNSSDLATMEENAKGFGLNNVTCLGSVSDSAVCRFPLWHFWWRRSILPARLHSCWAGIPRCGFSSTLWTSISSPPCPVFSPVRD